MSDSIWDNSSYLDASGYGVTTATTPEQAFGIQSSQVSTGTLTMALVLPRLNDPTALLGENWAQREAVLNGLTPAQVGAIYGADPARYAALTAYLSTVPGVTMRTAADGYVSSAQSRTVWVNLRRASVSDALRTKTTERHKQLEHDNPVLGWQPHAQCLARAAGRLVACRGPGGTGDAAGHLRRAAHGGSARHRQ